MTEDFDFNSGFQDGVKRSSYLRDKSMMVDHPDLSLTVDLLSHARNSIRPSDQPLTIPLLPPRRPVYVDPPKLHTGLTIRGPTGSSVYTAESSKVKASGNTDLTNFSWDKLVFVEKLGEGIFGEVSWFNRVSNCRFLFAASHRSITLHTGSPMLTRHLVLQIYENFL